MMIFMCFSVHTWSVRVLFCTGCAFLHWILQALLAASCYIGLVKCLVVLWLWAAVVASGGKTQAWGDIYYLVVSGISFRVLAVALGSCPNRKYLTHLEVELPYQTHEFILFSICLVTSCMWYNGGEEFDGDLVKIVLCPSLRLA